MTTISNKKITFLRRKTGALVAALGDGARYTPTRRRASPRPADCAAVTREGGRGGDDGENLDPVSAWSQGTAWDLLCLKAPGLLLKTFSEGQKALTLCALYQALH